MSGSGAYDSPDVQAAIHEEIGRQRHAEHQAVMRAVEALRSWDLDIDSYQAERLLGMWSGRGDLTDDQVHEAVALYLDGRQPTDVIEVALRAATGDAERVAAGLPSRALEEAQREAAIDAAQDGHEWPSLEVLRAVERLHSLDLQLNAHQAERVLARQRSQHPLSDVQVCEAVELYLAERVATGAIEVTLRNARRSWSVAGDDDERAEVLEYVLAAWYAAWPEDAVTDPHMPLAAEIVRLTGTARPEYALAVTDAGQLWLCDGCDVVEAVATGESPDPCVECDGTGTYARWQRLYTEVDQ